MTDIDIIRLLRTHSPRLIVFPNMTRAISHFHLNVPLALPKDLESDTNVLCSQLAIVRANPASRTPTAIRFISSTSDPRVYQGFSAPVDLIDPELFNRNDYHAWREAQARHERFRS